MSANESCLCVRCKSDVKVFFRRRLCLAGATGVRRRSQPCKNSTTAGPAGPWTKKRNLPTPLTISTSQEMPRLTPLQESFQKFFVVFGTKLSFQAELFFRELSIEFLSLFGPPITQTWLDVEKSESSLPWFERIYLRIDIRSRFRPHFSQADVGRPKQNCREQFSR